MTHYRVFYRPRGEDAYRSCGHSHTAMPAARRCISSVMAQQDIETYRIYSAPPGGFFDTKEEET